MYFEDCRKIEHNKKNFIITFFLLLKNSYVYLFRAAIYKLILVLHKDVLFHCWPLFTTFSLPVLVVGYEPWIFGK